MGGGLRGIKYVGRWHRGGIKNRKKHNFFLQKVLQNASVCGIISKHGQGGIAQLVRAHGSHP